MKTTVLPSLPAKNFDEILSLCNAVRGVVPELQIDIADGKLDKAISWPYTEVDPMKELERLKDVTKIFSVELHCMIMEPDQHLDLFASLGIKRLIVHIGSTNAYKEIINHAHTHGYKVGLCFTNDVPYEDYERFICDIDFVQVMGIAIIGAQGLPFDERVYDTVAMLRKKHPDLEIAVDGGVNKETITRLHDAGANRFAPGSAIAKQPDPAEAYHQLLAMVN